MKAELFCSSDCELAEGPVWYKDQLWWVDIEQGKLLNDHGEVYTAGHSIGAALPCESGRWILAGESGFYSWDLKGDTRLFLSRSTPSPVYRFNDAKVGPDGTLIAGSLQRETLEGDCAFYRLTSRLECSEILSGIKLCNGLGWNEEQSLFYYADTGARSIYRCPDQRWNEALVLIQMDKGLPDGLCVDACGNVWVAIWGESKVLCVDGQSGEVLKQIDVPAPHVTSCCFGGADFETLFITTARLGLGQEQLERFPQSGSIFCFSPGVKGVETRLFNDGGM